MSRLLSAATRPLHLLPPGLGVIAAGGLLVAGLPPLAIAVGVLSLGTWAALTGWEMAGGAPPPSPPPDPLAGIQAPELRDQLRSVLAAADRVRAQVEGHDGVLDGSFVEILAEQTELVTAATATARRADKVWALLRTVDPASLQGEVADRRAAARRAVDPEVRRSLEEAAAAKAREIDAWRSLAGLVDRVRAELVAADAALDELHARVVRLMMDDPSAAADASVATQVRSLAERLHGLERSVDATLKEMA